MNFSYLQSFSRDFRIFPVNFSSPSLFSDMYKKISAILLVCICCCLSFSQDQIPGAEQFKSSSLTWIGTNGTSRENSGAFHASQRSLNTASDSNVTPVFESLANWNSYNGIFSLDCFVNHTEKNPGYQLKSNEKDNHFSYQSN